MAPQRITFNYSLQGYEKGVPNIISTVLEDKEGNILAGIVDGGLAIKRNGADSFSLFKHNPADPHSLAPINIPVMLASFLSIYLYISLTNNFFPRVSTL